MGAMSFLRGQYWHLSMFSMDLSLADRKDSCSRSTMLQKDRMMTRLSYVEKQAFELLSNAETASDRYLIHLVRLEQIFERIDDSVVATANSVREADMHEFQNEINRYKATLPTEFAEIRE